MSWRQAIAMVEEEASLQVQEAFLAEGALGLEVDDDETRKIPEKPFAPTFQATITATFEPVDGVEERVQAQLDLRGLSCSIEWRDLADGDWANVFLSSWKSFSVGSNIWIVPSWEADTFHPPEPGALVLSLDPGMAFGTGHHETTTLCARAVYDAVKTASSPESVKVLDVGTGTGILAMIAAKLGSKRVVGTDNDPLACEVARENCAKNDVAGQIEISEAMPNHWGSVFDVVVANILANPLIEMAYEVSASIASSGVLFLSGILWQQEPDVRSAYEQAGLVHRGTERLNDWVLIRFEKP